MSDELKGTMTVNAARDLQRDLEVGLMRLIKEFEASTGCPVTKAELTDFSGTKYMVTSVWLGRNQRKERGTHDG